MVPHALRVNGYLLVSFKSIILYLFTTGSMVTAFHCICTWTMHSVNTLLNRLLLSESSHIINWNLKVSIITYSNISIHSHDYLYLNCCACGDKPCSDISLCVRVTLQCFAAVQSFKAALKQQLSAHCLAVWPAGLLLALTAQEKL